MPEDHVLVFHRVVPRRPLLHALGLLALVGELACGEELVVLIFGYPDGTRGELSPLHAEGFRTGKDHLAG